MILKIESIDGKNVLIIPQELLDKWNIKEDDKYKIVYENGSLLLIPEKNATGQID
jgi:hypothetical protein